MAEKQLNKTYALTLKAIRDLTMQTGFPPTMVELAASRGLSPTGAKKHVGVLCAAGLLSMRAKAARATRVTDGGRRLLKNRF
jgi:DNA-binding MarR family transcriptional regulator